MFRKKGESICLLWEKPGQLTEQAERTLRAILIIPVCALIASLFSMRKGLKSVLPATLNQVKNYFMITGKSILMNLLARIVVALNIKNKAVNQKPAGELVLI